MIRHLTLTFIQVTSLIVALTLLLAVTVQPVQASEMDSISASDGEQADDEVMLVSLALVGGTAILAGGMWMAKLRRMLS